MLSAVNPPLCLPMMDCGSYSYALAHECLRHPEYMTRCKVAAGIKYLILDNGADELGEGLRGIDFENILFAVKPSEVIAPDVIGDSKETEVRTVQFLETLEGFRKQYPNDKWLQRLRVMAVAQGLEYND